MSDNVFGFSSSDPYFYISSEDRMQQSQLIRLIQGQQHENQGFISQLFHEQQSDDEFDCSNEDNEYKIEAGANFPNWKSLESALEKHELEVGFKSIKFRIERDNNGDIIRRYFVCENSKEQQSKKKIIDADHRERNSKKVGCLWQLNAG
ncbi:3020_t:CDS:2, partial [Racocetra persica]